MRAIDNNGDAKQSPTIQGKTTHCENQLDFYGNFQVANFTSEVLADYIINLTHLTPPAWVATQHFGIVDAAIDIVHMPLSGKHCIHVVNTTILSICHYTFN